MPRYFENGLLDAISEGGKSAFWGVFALWTGFAWGGIIAADEMNALHWTGIWGVVVTLGAVGTPWGWLLLFILPVFIVCSIWREWNRLMVTSSLATFVGTIGLRYCWPWPDYMSPCPWHRLIYPITLLAITLLVPLLLRLFRPRATPRPSSPPATPETPEHPEPLEDPASPFSRLPSTAIDCNRLPSISTHQ